jgi:polysaccharide biosynthesis transport protein
MVRDSNPKRLPSPEGATHAPRVDGEVSSREVWGYIDVLRRRWWLIAAAALLGLGGAWWNQQGRVPVYTAEVLLEQRRDAPVVGMGVGIGGGSFVQQLETIRTRAVMTEVVDRLGLQLNLWDRAAEWSRIIGEVEVEPDVRSGPYTLRLQGQELVLLEGVANGQRPGDLTPISTASVDEWIEGPGFRLRVADPTALSEEPARFSFQDRQAAIERLRRQIQLEPGRAPTLVRVMYRSQDPQLAADVANGVATAYQDYRARAGREMASRRREVITDQLVSLADSLERAQAAVVEYQRDARLLDPSYEGNRAMETVLGTENEIRTMRFQEGVLSGVVAGLQGDGEIADQSLDRILSLGGNLVPGGEALHRRLQDLQIERARLTASRFGRTEGDPEVEVVDSLIVSTKRQIRSAAEQGLEHLRVQIDGHEQRLAEARGSMSAVPAQTAELSQLRQRADAVQDIVDALVDRYYEAQITEAVEAGDIAIIDPAVVPLSPDSTPTRPMLLMGLMAGGMLGTLGAFGIEYMNVRVRGSEEAEEVTGLPLFGMIPKLRAPGRDPVSAAIAREAFRSVRTNLNFVQPTGDRVIAVTSATPREGKTTVAVNVAMSLAEQEGAGSVLLLDADLRRPQVHSSLQMPRTPGLTECLRNGIGLDQAIQTSPAHPNLYVLCAGSTVTDPSELISGPAFSALLERLRAEFDYIVVDTPPLLAVTDGLVIASLVEGTLVVVRANQTDRDAVGSAMAQLRRVDASLLGVVLNAVETSSRDGRYAYSYYNDYLADEPAGAGRGRNGRRLLQGVGR